MTYVGKKPADIIATAVDTTTGTFSGDLTVDTSTLVVDSANNRVGVGTSSPNEKLTISSGAISFLGEISTPSIGAGLFRPANNTLAVVTGSTERMRITSAGFVGIGTSSPNSSWSSANNLVISDTSSDGGMTILSGTSGNGNIMFADAQGSAFSDARGLITYLHASDALRFMTANAERLRINSSGQVGIGTASPIATLHTASGSSGRSWSNGVDRVIHEANATNIMQIVTSTTGTAGVNFADTDARAVSGVEYDHNAKSMAIAVNEGSGTIKFFNTS